MFIFKLISFWIALTLAIHAASEKLPDYDPWVRGSISPIARLHRELYGVGGAFATVTSASKFENLAFLAGRTSEDKEQLIKMLNNLPGTYHESMVKVCDFILNETIPVKACEKVFDVCKQIPESAFDSVIAAYLEHRDHPLIKRIDQTMTLKLDEMLGQIETKKDLSLSWMKIPVIFMTEIGQPKHMSTPEQRTPTPIPDFSFLDEDEVDLCRLSDSGPGD